MEKIQMVDLGRQYHHIKEDVESGIAEVIQNCSFINGPQVKSFQANLETFLGVKHVIPCGNGTDALQIALMALDLEPGDEVIVPSFTYIATAEVIGLLRLKPIMVDVDAQTFNLSAENVAAAITDKTKVIVPVHLYGQIADMEGIMKIAKEKGIYVIEDNAQAIGATYTFSNGKKVKAGGIGDIGCTSFYPSKNLGAYGDGGAITTNNDELAALIRKVANHGQAKRYYHDVIGVNSRLDSIQAVVLDAKLKHLDTFNGNRNAVATRYDNAFADNPHLETPFRNSSSNHVFHQYTLKVKGGKRNELEAYLKSKDVPCMIYYPVPLYKQEAFKAYIETGFELNVTEELCNTVLSLPIHSEMDEEQLIHITKTVNEFFNKK